MDSPAAFARAIAERTSRAERDAALLQVSDQFRPLVSRLVAYMIAGQICALSSREARQAAVRDVPACLVDEVCSLVTMRFQAAAELRRRTPSDVQH